MSAFLATGPTCNLLIKNVAKTEECLLRVKVMQNIYV